MFCFADHCPKRESRDSNLKKLSNLASAFLVTHTLLI